MELTIENPKEHKLPMATHAACLVLLVWLIRRLMEYYLMVVDFKYDTLRLKGRCYGSRG